MKLLENIKRKLCSQVAAESVPSANQQASQWDVDKMNRTERHRLEALVKVCKKAWKAVPPVKILQAFEMRKDCAQEAITTDGWCNQEGKGLGGAKRVHVDASYAALRKRLKIG